MSVTNENKIIAKTTLDVFGGSPKVTAYWDDDNVSRIDILTTTNGLYSDITPYATIGLSDYSIGYDVDNKPLRVEIVGACDQSFDYLPNILATCAFNIINSKFRISHGCMFKNVVGMYDQDSEMSHVLFVSPFLWEQFQTIDFPDKKVTWLLAVPISTKEYLYVEKEGSEALEDLFEEKEVDIFDLKRPSIL